VRKAFSGVHLSISPDIQYISAMLDINGEFFHQNQQQILFLITTPNCVFVAYFLPVILLFRLY